MLTHFGHLRLPWRSLAHQDWDLRALGAHFGSSRSSLWMPGAHSGAPTLAIGLHGEAGGSAWSPVWEDFENHFGSSRVMGNMLATKLRTCTKHHYTYTDCMCAPPLESSMFSHIGAKSQLKALPERWEQKSRPNCQSLTNHASTVDKRFKANAGAKT